MDKEGSLPSCQDSVTGPRNGAGRLHSSLLCSVCRILILAFLPSGAMCLVSGFCAAAFCIWTHGNQCLWADCFTAGWPGLDPPRWRFFYLCRHVQSACGDHTVCCSSILVRLSVNAAFTAWSRWFFSTLCYGLCREIYRHLLEWRASWASWRFLFIFVVYVIKSVVSWIRPRRKHR